MNIIYFLDYGKEYGGAANTLIQQALIIKALGHDVTLYVSSYISDNFSEEYKSKIELTHLTVKRCCFFLSSEPEDIDVINIDEEYDAIKKEIVDAQPNIVHSVQLNPVVELICRELNIPHIMSIYVLSDDFFHISYLDVFPRYLVTDSMYCAKQWSKHLKIKYDCIRTIARVSAHSRNISDHRQDIKCICVGSIYKGKNQLEVIKGFHNALMKGFHGSLELYGYSTGPYADMCNQYITENNLEDQIRICGFCSNMTEVYERSDVLICGSRRESYPNAVSEAMAGGLVVVSTPVGGVPELVFDKINGFVTNGYSGADIYEKLMDLDSALSDRSIQEIIRRSISTAMKEHSPERVGGKLALFYQKVISDHKSTDLSLLPRVEAIRNKYERLIRVYKNNKDSYSYGKLVASKIWYLGYVENSVLDAYKSGREFYLWGAGKFGNLVLEIMNTFFPEICITGFIDSFANGEFRGYKVYSPKEVLVSESSVIVVSLGEGQWEVVKMLEDHNKLLGQDYYVFAPRTW